jgi:acyl-CoA synthetase (AMP-forming)/AMP-acid ligase II
VAFPDYTHTVPAMLRELVRRFGPRELIVLGERRLTYAQADAASARLARGLLARGVAKGARVGVLFPNGPDWLVAWLAASRIGAVVVPINTFYKPRELGYVLRHADVHTLLTARSMLGNDYLARLVEFAPSLAGQKGELLFARELPALRAVYVWGDPQPHAFARPVAELEAAGDAAPIGDELLAALEAEVAPADPAILIYSSGSTAEPKGAVHAHSTLIRHPFNLSQFRDLRGDDRVFTPMPFFWVGGLVFSLLSTAQVGACILCEEFFEPGATLALLERERATIAMGWPHYSKAMAEHPSIATRDLSAVRGGNLWAVLPTSARPRDPELRPNSLGMTETCGPHTFDVMETELPERLRGSFGHSVPGVEHKVVDPATGATLAPGESGELCVRGYSVMQGLHKQEREQTFDRDGFYHTGDAGRFDADGHLFFEARLGDMIKTAGANVAPRELEVLLEAMPEVSSAYVVGIADEKRGQAVTGAVVLKPGAELDADTCRERLRKDVSAYKVPQEIVFAQKEELPFTDSGKIDKRKLAVWMEQRLRGA